MSHLTRYLDPQVIQQVGRLDLRARFLVEGFLAGLHSSPFQGLSVEFSEHRKYVQGDDLRTIDWNVFARTDRLYVRKHPAATRLACHRLVDSSAGPRAVRRPGRRGPRARELRCAEGGTGRGRGVPEGVRRMRHRGLLIVVSDLLTDQYDCFEALHHVRFRGHDLIVMHVLDAAEAKFPFDGEVRLEDPETGQTLVTDSESVRRPYIEAIADWRKELSDRLSAIRADYVALDTSMPFDKALVEFLVQRTRRI